MFRGAAFREATSEEPSSRETIMAPPSVGPASMETPTRAATSQNPALHTCRLAAIGIRKPGFWKPSQQSRSQYKYPDLTLLGRALDWIAVPLVVVY